MTTSARCIDRVSRYNSDQITGRQHVRLRDDDITIAQWIGEFAPARIEVIPLFEDVAKILPAHAIWGRCARKIAGALRFVKRPTASPVPMCYPWRK